MSSVGGAVTSIEVDDVSMAEMSYVINAFRVCVCLFVLSMFVVTIACHPSIAPETTTEEGRLRTEMYRIEWHTAVTAFMFKSNILIDDK